ncbi:MAG: CDGSH iron-sulfur domain-containing protein [Spirochaetaceae bacterium]|jgi:CDGSH-type Zn-finger protein|nr:CDGSH iron-sulfur domain-containing protein [Spirochaetaceae bacterium]
MEKTNHHGGEGMILAPEKFYILIEEEGPYLVFGTPPINQQIITMNSDGESWWYREGRSFDNKEPCALCRCGESHNKPFCDGHHTSADWDPVLTGPEKFDLKKAEMFEGPMIVLSDNQEFCAYARFCDAKGQIWNIVQEADTKEEADLVIREAGHCPGGRLIAWDRETGEPIEPHFEPSIGIIQDPALKISGPIWVRGGIRIKSENGKEYDVRNRVALCRCGKSSNKPFCNGAHASVHFHDGLPDKPKEGGEVF